MYGGWGGFIARTAVRKVVYVLVGLALAALLAVSGVAVSGVRALGSDLAAGVVPTVSSAYTGCPGCGSGAAGSTDGDDATAWVGNSDTVASAIFDLGTPTAVGAYRLRSVNCQMGIYKSSDGTTWGTAIDVVGAASGTPSDTGTVTLGSTLTYRYWKVQGNGVCLGGTPYPAIDTLQLFAPDPPPTPTPTATPTPAPSSGPLCVPYCVVVLSDTDRAKLDAIHADAGDLSTIVAYGLGLVVFLGSAIAVAIGLRR